MGIASVLNLCVQFLYLTMLASLPVVVAAATVGVVVSLIQALTQIQEQTLAFSFKLIAVTIVLYVMLEGVGSSFLLATRQILRLIQYF